MMNALLIGLTFVAGAPALKGPAKGDPPPIEGLWKLTEYLQNGGPIGFQEGASTEFLCDGKRLWRDAAGAPADERGYKLIEKSSPPALDLIRPNGVGQPPDVFLCIYKIEDDRLVITIGPQNGERPTKHGEGWMVMKYKRANRE
jgi:uncharacterized protein (TIGR03067 family)